jgi:hypothetical protein
MLKCSDTQILRYSDTQILRYSDTQILRYSLKFFRGESHGA